MINVILTECNPIKLWLSDIEHDAMDQAKHLANLPFCFKHVCLMPDAHFGYGMPIGGVLATYSNVVIPNAVGVDIGCGMCAVKTSQQFGDVDRLKNVLGKIRDRVPVGFSHHKEKQHVDFVFEKDDLFGNLWESARYQVGTLGGGNHFIEIQKDKDDYLWIMIHSGSRNVGKTVADYYNKAAKLINSNYFSSVPPEWDLAFLNTDSEIGKKYLVDMDRCINFARCNRALMMLRCQDAFSDVFHSTDFGNVIECTHNYAAIENHFGNNVMVHRKGACLARKDMAVIIPGSQGTKSYIANGLGNAQSFCSCSHGAGRKMGRKQARMTLDLIDQTKALDDKGILHAMRGKDDLDEAPGAYKDIDIVMKNQEDLVEIVVELAPLAVIKG